jgi:4-hydroxy-tetrahydrodipicolinate synthase
MIEWYIASGCTGLFAVCQSSEMYFMTNEERLALATHVVGKAAGRVSE